MGNHKGNNLGAWLLVCASAAALFVVGLRFFPENAYASGISSVVSVFGQTGIVSTPVTTADIATPSNPPSGKTAWYTKNGTLCSLSPGGVEACTTTGGGGGPSANQNIRSFGASFDGAGTALAAASTTYVTVPFACTIAAWNITVDTGTISFDVWKVATGTSIPTIANTILSGGFLSLTTGTAIHSTTLANFTTTAVAANDILGFSIHAVSGATKTSLVIQCNATT